MVRLLPTNAKAFFCFFLTIVIGSFVLSSTSVYGATNLIANPSLEDGGSTPTNWTASAWGTNAPVFTYPVSGVTGDKAAKVALTSRTSGDAKWFFADVVVNPGTSYTFSDYYTSSIASNITLRYTFSSGAVSYVWLADLPASSSWKKFETTFIPPSGAVSVTAFHLIAGVGELTIDDVSITTADVTPPPSGLIANASLEEGSSSPAGWNKGQWGDLSATFTYPVSGYQGDKAAGVSVSRYVSGDAKWFFAPITTSPGVTYTFSNAYTSTVPTTITAQVRLVNGTYTYLHVGNAPSSSEWRTFQGSFTTPANAVEVTVFHTIAAVGSLSVDAYSLTRSGGGGGGSGSTFAEGMVTLDFDDGWKSQYTKAIPILNAAGIKASFHIITDVVGASGYMTWADITAIKNAGHEIGAHTRTHPDLATLTPARARAEIVGSRDALIAKGFTPETFVYPYGSFTPSVQQMVKDAGFIGARSVNTGFNTKTNDRYALLDQHLEKPTTIADLKRWVDEAIATKKWLIIEAHEQKVGGSTWSNDPAVLQALVDYLKQKNVKTVTLREGIQMLP